MSLRLFILIFLCNTTSFARGGESLAYGSWFIEGYNYTVEVDRYGWKQFFHTSISCMKIAEGRGRFPYSVKENRSSTQVVLKEGITEYLATRVQMPENCLTKEKEITDDTGRNFRVFWQYFKENYAHFSTRGIDWEQVYQVNKSLLQSSVSDNDLWTALESVVRSTGDGHVTLVDESSSPIRIVEGDDAASSKLAMYLEDEFSEDQSLMSFSSRYLHYKALIFDKIYNEKLNKQWGNVNDSLWGGDLSPTIGYINISYMHGFSNENWLQSILASAYGAVRNIFLEKGEFSNGRIFQEDVALAPVIDELSDRIQKYEALVLDLRMNPGGEDFLALRMASVFVDRKRLAFRKKAKSAKSFTSEQSVFIHPRSEKSFLKPVYLLTSRRTGSAAEVFVLAMRVLPHVSVIGENTAGGLSDAHQGILPNGWKVTLSNEIYTAADGEIYEGRGIPPDRYVESFVQGSLVNSYIGMLDEVMGFIAKK